MKIISLDNLQIYDELIKNEIRNMVIKYDNMSLFPSTGKPNTIYVDKSTHFIYYWNSNQYTKISSGSIVIEDSYIKFPVVGENNAIYIDTTENAIYRYSEEELKYYLVMSDWNNIKLINAMF